MQRTVSYALATILVALLLRISGVHALSSVLVICGPVAMYFLPSRTSNDPYGLFHLSLNTTPQDDPNGPPRTEWLNMGFWKV